MSTLDDTLAVYGGTAVGIENNGTIIEICIQRNIHCFGVSNIIRVGDLCCVIIYGQCSSVYGTAIPAAGFGNIEAAWQRGEVKLPVKVYGYGISLWRAVPGYDAGSTDVQTGKMVIVTIEPFKSCILTEIQGSQLVAAAIKGNESRIFTHVQRIQLIVVAIERGEGRILTELQRGQLVAVAIKGGERGVAAQIQRSQLVVTAVESSESHICTEIHRGQLVFAAIKACESRICTELQGSQLVVVAVQVRKSCI